MKTIGKCLFVVLLLSCGQALAQDKRVSCDILKQIDLKPLLGADHDPLAPFGGAACQAESKAIGRGLVILTVEEGALADIKKGLASIRQINTKERAKEVTVAAEPELGPEAFSVREKDQRKVEIYAVKGSRAVIVQGMWAIGPTITDDVFGKLRGVAQAALAKLP
jgi:hypothetical protein